MSRGPLAWLGAILALYLLGPLVAFAVRFALPGEHGFDQLGLWGAFGTSVVSASISTVIVAVFGIPLAHRLAASDGWVARGVGLLVQLPLALPPVMSGIVLIYVVGPYTPIGTFFGDRLTDTIAGVVVAQTFVSAPFLVIGARSAFRAVDPALNEVAATLGHRPASRFFRVAIPAASDGIRAALVLTWLRALGEYGATALLAYHPYTLPVFTNVQFQGSGLPTTQAPTALALGIAIVAVLVGAVRFRRRRRHVALPESLQPARVDPAPVRFAVRTTRGAFGLEAAHASASHRLAILGPSGAGKSLTLRAVAGLAPDATSGGVSVGPTEVDGLRAEDRRIGFVPQGGVLLPRRTVWEQVCFGVGTDPGVAAWWLRTLRIDDLADRLPDELSGGQRQRVALAQALARQPSVVLLDEPFSALDGPVRDELRTEFRRLQRERGLSTIVVTHDPEEAAVLADQVLVLDSGRVLQGGDLAGVYRRPGSPVVARLVGVRNVHDGVAGVGGSILVGGRVAVPGAGVGAAPGRGAGSVPAVGVPVSWSVRPEAVRIDGAAASSGSAESVGSVGSVGAPDRSAGLAAVVLDVVALGAGCLVEVELPDGSSLLVRTPAAAPPPDVGSHVALTIAPDDVSVWTH
jgi:ABC-type Fe3+/spermidine/putrescine transport system ATPase subunit/ABC-type sulfate transport system permease component